MGEPVQDVEWDWFDSFCHQHPDGRLYIRDEMLEKRPELETYRRQWLGSWTRVPDAHIWISTERNPWHLIHAGVPLR